MKHKFFLTITLIIVSYFVQAQSAPKQCKYLFFSCPPTSGIICNNSGQYKELEASGDGFGIYKKNAKGCWVIIKNDAPIQVPADGPVTTWIKKWFGSNSLKPSK